MELPFIPLDSESCRHVRADQAVQASTDRKAQG